MTRPRIALVGSGTMGAYHARVVNQSPNAHLAFVVEPDEKVGRPVAERIGAAWVVDLDEIYDVQGVIIAAATEAHDSLARRVLEADLPLLVEKPLASDLATATEIVELSAKRSVPLMCGLLERYNGAVMTAMSLVRAPVHVSAVRHSPYAPRIRTGVAWDLLVHDVDLALRLLGPEPVNVVGRLGRFHPSSTLDAEDVAEAMMTYQDGTLGTASASRIGQKKIRALSIHEVDRLIEVDLLRRDVTIYRHVANDAADDRGLGYRQQSIIEIPELVSAQEPLAAQFDRFLELLTGSTDADSERETILPAHRVVDQIKKGDALPANATGDRG